MKLKFYLFLLPFLLSTVQVPLQAQPSLLQQGREALTDRRYDEAARLLAQAASPGQERADEAQLLLGHALLGAKKYDDALAAYEKLLRDFPNSPWRKKAVFKKGDVFIAQKQWDKAATIYEPELDYIVSDDRKEQVAEIYLKYANQYFEPPQKTKDDTPQPNYAKAKVLFQKSLEIGLTPKKTEEVTLRIALSDFRAGRYAEAITTLRDLLTKYPQGAQVEEAKYHLGLSYLRSGNDREARKIFRDFLRDYPSAKRRIDVAWALAETYHVPNPRDSKELQLGIQALRDLIRDFAESQKALTASYYIGLSLFNQARYEDAVKEFNAFIAAYARSNDDALAQAKNYLGQALLRQKKYDAAISAWETFLREHPDHALWQTVQRQVIDAYYAIGDEAYTKKQYDTARKAWQAFQDKYPLDLRNADIMFRLGMMFYDAKQYDAAIEQWKKVIGKYPSTEAASRAQFMTAMTYETMGRFDDALIAHRGVTGKWQSDAQARLSELKNRKMLVYTERTFTTTDKPALKLVTRNVKNVQLRAYKVDMNDYFRKLHTMRGVERLDLALIEPDWRWALDITDYQDYRQSETAAPLPFKEPGVYAVVSSAPLPVDKDKPDNPDNAPSLEATNIVMVSDLGIITKVTHNDVLVFTQNLVTRAPWPNTQILLTDGHRIVANGTTNGDGIFQWKNEAPLKTAAVTVAPLQSNVRVLAQNNAHFASTENNLTAVARVAGLTPRGLVYTDRPLYRAGQPVFFRAIVRQVENGQYIFKKGDDYLVQVTDAGGAIVYSKKLNLNDFGTVGDSLTLNGEAPPGRYTIYVTRPQQKVEDDTPQILPVEAAPRPVTLSLQRQSFSATGYFQVAAYKLEKVRISIELPKTVYLRGEEIKGKVIAKYLHGEPLAKRKIRFGWNNEIGEERETDAKGEFEFTVPTRAFDEDQTVLLWARMEEENAASQRAAYVATVGVRPTLSMLRDVHLLGEKFDISIETKDLADKPFSGNFKLVALKMEKDDAGRLGEREVQSLPVITGTDGKTTASLSLTEPGEYVLRLSGQDGNGNPVSIDLATKVVGDEDKVRLRLLTDGDSYKLGETVKLRTIWRGAEKEEAKELPPDAATPRLALVTYEGDRVYGYQLVTLQKSEDNQIAVPLTAPMAPLFRVSIALMDGNQFHEASKWLSVERDLKVQIKTNQDKYRPGDKVKADITVTDQNGKPVAAELSLAVVDQALLSLANGETVSVASLLQTRAARDDAIQTLTSATFHYAAEARQRALQVKEAESLQRTMLAGSAEGADLPRGHWAYDALNRLAQSGLVEGAPEGSYMGNKAITRYEAAVAIARTLQNSTINQLSSNLGRQRANVDLKNYAGAARDFDMIAALKNEFAPELSRMGVDLDGTDARVVALENRNPAPPRLTAGLGILNRTGNNAAIQSSAGGAGIYGYGDFGGIQQGLRGPQGAPGPTGDKADLSAFIRRGVIPQFGQQQNAAQGAQNAQGLFYDNDIAGNALFAGGDRVFDLPEGIEAMAAIDVQNAFLVRGTAGEAEFAKLLGDVPAEQREAIISGLRSRFAETAFWDAHIFTGEDGKASAEFTLPGALTEWNLIAAGVTRDTIAGQGKQTITSSKLFSVEIKTPSPLQQGDRATIAAVLHNNSAAPIKAQVTLRAKFGTQEKAVPKTVSIEANATQQITLDIDVPDVREGKISVQASGGGQNDATEEIVAVRPWGIEHLAVAGGLAEGSRSLDVKLPRAKYDTYRLKLTVGPGAAGALLDIAANAGDTWRAPVIAGSAQRALALIHAIGYLRAQGRGDDPLHARLSSDLEGHLARLAKAQNGDGGWSWALPQREKNRTSDLATTVDAFSALAQGKQLGFKVTPSILSKANAYLQTQYSALGESGNDTKAPILYAQSVAKTVDFATLNRLYRLRNSLTPRSLAYLALGLQHADRAPEAQEIVRLLEERIPKEALKNPTPSPIVARSAISANALNLRNTDDVALATLAIARVTPKNLLLTDLSQWLWAQRAGNGWGTPRATAYTIAALVQNEFATKRAPEKYNLSIAVNGRALKSLAVDGNAKTISLDAPAELVNGPTAKVEFTFAGKGTYSYSAELSGFTTEGLMDDAAREKKDERGPATGPLIIQRTYTQAPMLFNGKVVPRGFGTVSTDDTWENKADEVPVGNRVQVQLTWWTPNDTWIGDRRGNYIVVREPLPAGCRVDENSISGDFERYEIGDGAITFYFYDLRDPGVSYDLYGVREGTYRVLPTKIWAFERPSLYAYGTFKALAVVPRGTAIKNTYRLTPDELYYLGTAHFDRVQEAIANGKAPSEADLKSAEDHLLALFNKDADPKGWKLHDDPARETVRMLFTLALRRNDAARTVRFFEVLRERFPQVVIPFKEIVQTAKAYGNLGEREREVQVLRVTAEASFSREAKVAAALEDEGEYNASYAYVAERTREYPDVANVESALYALAQTVAQRADEERKKGKIENSKELGKTAANLLRDFLALHSDNPAGDEAAFAYAVNLVEQEKFDDAVAWSQRSLARYENSAYADDLIYIATYASYLGERFDDALKLAQELASKDYLQTDGTRAKSGYRNFALYIAAQIFHARGQASKAVEFYKQVGAQFPDARESAAYFQARELKIPEVVAIAPGEPARLKISARNVPEVQVSVYKVDLLKFYQNRKNLVDLGAMNLAGIKPVWESTVDLGEARFVDKTKTIELPLPAQGAYFVALKADDGEMRLNASGVVVRSQIALDVQEDSTSGRVRVNVAKRAPNSANTTEGEGKGGPPLSKAEVWVIGSVNDSFRKGQSDLRGIVMADDVRGKPTVIAYKDGDYAFYRSEKILQPQYVAASTSTGAAKIASEAKSFKDQARDAYIGNNMEVQKKQAENYRVLQGKGNNANAPAPADAMGIAAGKAF